MNDIGEFLESGALSFDTPITIFEVGAHVGSDSRQLRHLFPKASIHCFEPDPRNIFKFKSAGIHKTVNLVEAAVSDRDGEATMNLSSGKPLRKDAAIGLGPWTYSSSLKKPAGHLEAFPWVKFDTTAKVRTIRLDTYTQQHGIGDIDFLWADVQGAEDQLLAGGQQTLARTRYLYTEYADRPLYEGQIPFDEIMRRLPGQWEILARFPEDAIVRNVAFPRDPILDQIG